MAVMSDARTTLAPSSRSSRGRRTWAGIVGAPPARCSFWRDAKSARSTRSSTVSQSRFAVLGTATSSTVARPRYQHGTVCPTPLAGSAFEADVDVVGVPRPRPGVESPGEVRRRRDRRDLLDDWRVLLPPSPSSAPPAVRPASPLISPRSALHTVSVSRRGAVSAAVLIGGGQDWSRLASLERRLEVRRDPHRRRDGGVSGPAAAAAGPVATRDRTDMMWRVRDRTKRCPR
mmetsp:Transcript_3622/g.11323  ORF Transcript_3622/g.11323 Transcript_3622/m.11323 type:complete len:231 (-) Transcript_3622:52-744(-)